MKFNQKYSISAVFATFGLNQILADTPAECHYEAIKGLWRFKFTTIGQNNSIECPAMNRTIFPPGSTTTRDEDAFPNQLNFQFHDINKFSKVIPRTNGYEVMSTGTFTLIYGQGFEAILEGRKWFAFFDWDEDSSPFDPAAKCGFTKNGWVHDLQSNDWGCFYAEKIDDAFEQKMVLENNGGKSKPFIQLSRDDSEMPKKFKNMVRMSKNDDFNPIKLGMKKRREFPRNIKSFKVLEQELDSAIEKIKNNKSGKLEYIPDSFDWNDKNMVSPVKDQSHCGSCYAFGSVGLFESRARVQTDNKWQPLFSEQDIVSCSEYSQGCSGGFPYLMSKYAQDYGLIEENLYPYTSGEQGEDGQCLRSSIIEQNNNKLWKVMDYGYIGDFYGGASEAAMREELYYWGPIAVSFDANGLHDYEGGVWYPEAQMSSVQFDPFEYTNHVVLITGFGWEDGVPFWNVKNSWGTGFGEEGYFRIVRGVDAAGIESLPVWASMVPPMNV